MEQQLPENMRVLRLFGAEKESVDRVLGLAQNNQSIQVQRLEQDAETLLLLEAVTRSGSATTAVLGAWQEQVAQHCGDALYGVGETTLTKAMLSAFFEADKLFACVDAATSALLETKLGGLQGIEEVYDFGAHSHAHPKIGRKIEAGSSFAKKHPDQEAQYAAGQLKAAYQYAGADCILAILAVQDGSHLVLVGGKTSYAIRRVAATENMLLWAVDMLRRAALDKKQAKGTIQLAYGAALPAFAMVAAQQPVQPVQQSQPMQQRPVQVATQSQSRRINVQPAQTASAKAWVVPDQAEFDAPPPPQPAKKAGGTLVFALVMVLLFAIAAVTVLYYYTGGDIGSLWYGSEFNRYNVSSATLL